MTDAILKERSNHSACCAQWLVTIVDQKADTGQILYLGPSQTGCEHRVAVLRVERLMALGLEVGGA